MMNAIKRAFNMIAIVTVGLAMTSCSTAFILQEEDHYEPKVYGGTAINLEIMSGCGSYYDMGGGAGACLCLFSVVDLPLSFIADTVVLPYTIYYDATNENLKDEEPTK
ncbi:hypothetical protein BVX97_03385 [bacterium E08(2017)]|nr:hypothetical protein BVX97_03385 [bacterium E08(2017)]